MSKDPPFAHSYEWEPVQEFEGSPTTPIYYYPRRKIDGGKDGLLVKVYPSQGVPWFGVFAFGGISPRGASGIFTTPDADRLCVVSRGAGYLVSTTAPDLWEKIHSNPILNVFPIIARRIIVFSDYTRLVAYDDTGKKWRTKRLTWDSMEITGVTDGSITGQFWDVRTEKTASFIVDLSSGENVGGVE